MAAGGSSPPMETPEFLRAQQLCQLPGPHCCFNVWTGRPPWVRGLGFGDGSADREARVLEGSSLQSHLRQRGPPVWGPGLPGLRARGRVVLTEPKEMEEKGPQSPVTASSRKEKNPGLGEWTDFPIFQVRKPRPEDVKPLAWVRSVRTPPVFFISFASEGLWLAADGPLGGEGRGLRFTRGGGRRLWL